MAIAAMIMVFIDFGTPQSPVMTGWERLTPNETPLWVTTTSQTAEFKAWPRELENKSAGRMDPPPVYTNDLLADCVIGSETATLRLPLAKGEYELWFAAGCSNRHPYEVFDFTVSAGDGSAGVQLEGGYWFETRRFRFKADGQTDIVIDPKSKYALAAMAVYPVDQAEAIQAKYLEQHEQSIYLLPPDILETWRQQDITDPVGQLPTIPAASKQRGYLVHHRPWQENVYPHTMPYAAELDPTLRAFATLGEREPLTFSVYALRDLKRCQVKVSALQRDGATIPATELDLKLVQFANSKDNYRATGTYHLVPDYLRPFETVDIPAKTNQRFWLTVHVPENSPPGVYSGQATFQPEGGTVTTVPLRLKVLPITLQQDPDKVYGMYYRNPLDKAERAEDDYSREYFEQQAAIQAQDFLDHGSVLCVPLSAWISVPREPKDEFKPEFNWDSLVRRIEWCRQYGYPGPYIVSINDEGLYQRHQGGERYGSHLRGAKPCPEPYSTELQQMVQFIEDGRKERGLPVFLYYPVDEPGVTPENVAYMVQTLKAIQAAGGKTYVTADPTHEQFAPMAPFVDVWCTQPFLPEREVVVKDMAERDVEYWCYPNHINGENDHTVVTGARMTYGFGFWRSGFLTLIPWIYSSTSASPFNNLDGGAQDFFNRPGPDGTVWPVPMWEAYREGWDDYRYVYTCQQLIAKARAAGKTAEADRAQAVLDDIWNAIEVKAKYKLDGDCWGYREFDLRRWQLAESILSLQAALN